MIAIDVVDALQGWVAGVMESLDDRITVYREGDLGPLERPCVIVRVTSTNEHELLRRTDNVLVQLELQAVPEDTSLQDFRLWMWSLECLAQHREGIAGALEGGNVKKVYDSRALPGTWDVSDDLRRAMVSIRITLEENDSP